MNHDQGGEDLRRVASKAVSELCAVLSEVESIVLFNTGGLDDQAGVYISDIGGSCEVIAHAGQPITIPQEDVLTCANAFPVAKVFYASDNESGLETYLPPGVQSHLVLPLQAAERPLYLLLDCSVAPHYSFPAIDVDIIRSPRTPDAYAWRQGFLERFRRLVDPQDWEDFEGPLRLGESSGRVLLNILNDVLDFGKARASVCLDHYGEAMGVKGRIRLEYEDRDWRVNISAAKFQRIVTNGLTNAIKFCPDGDIIISLHTTPDQKSVVLEIQDRGIGIAAESLPRLMQPFTKMDPHSLGAGLGLYITRSLGGNMAGQLSLLSTLHERTTLSATLPVPVTNTSCPYLSLLHRELRGPSDKRQGAPHALLSAAVARSTLNVGAAPPELHSFKRKRDSAPLSLPDYQLAAAVDPIRFLIIDDNTICRKILRMAF